ncbi:fibropellin-1-like isoform X3 [Littorina saxatilis]|uniref:fibropellin-1-like isoform X3 n=1 Tax=Littorina saxatilis TaxID=31220 RepID=UPI0038B4B743
MGRYAVTVLAVMVALALRSVDGGITRDRGHVSEDGSNPDALPSRLSVTVDMGGSSLDLNLDRTSDLQTHLPVYSIHTDHTGRFHVSRTKSQTVFKMYQDRDKEAAFVFTTRTDDEGNTTETLEGMVQSGGKVYHVGTGIRGLPQGRSLSGDLDLQFDVHDLDINANDFFADYTVPDAEPDQGEDGVVVVTDENNSGTEEEENSHERYRRQADQDVFIDIVAFVDNKIYLYWYSRSTESAAADKRQDAIDKVTQYYAFVFNGIDRMYKTLTTLSYVMHVRLIGLIIAETAADSPITEDLRVAVAGNGLDQVDANVALADIKNMLSTADNIPSHDHFMYFTGYDLTMGSSASVAGLAYVGTTCQINGYQSSINEDKANYQCTFIAAHELGHSLSARHDGSEGNACVNGARFIMSTGGEPQTESNKLNVWHFSTCSADYFRSYVTAKVATAPGRQCMYEKLEVNATLPDVEGLMPGQVEDADAQCKRAIGPNATAIGLCISYMNGTEDVCTNLNCHIKDPDRPGYYSCHSRKAFRGTDCGIDKWCINGECISKSQTNECASSPCKNGGTCNNMIGYFTCTCPPDFSGDWCEDAVANIDECASNPCQNGGTCTDGDNSFSCSCPSGISGLQCEVACTWTDQQNTAGAQNLATDLGADVGSTLDTCKGLCEADPNCLAIDWSFISCNGFTTIPPTSAFANRIYSVKSCANVPDADDCASGPCLNGGACTDLVGSYSCACLPGYSGSRCENNNNECASYPCLNGGTCSDGINSYSCRCPPRYSGSRCQDAVVQCLYNPCQNGATCDYNNYSYNCDCAPGFSGPYCEETVSQCPYNPCQNGGTCDYTNNSYNCDCAPDFSGTYCEETTARQCPYNPCQNGGTCDYTNNSYNCDCAPDFSGTYCEETTARQCPYNPCQNGGTCDYTNNSYNCDCAPDFSGTYCEETTARQCPYNPCQNGGTCDYTNNSYNCDCAPDFSGTYCEETTARQCPYNPCQNGGTCDYTNNSYNCDCAPDFSGTYCEETTARQCPYNPCQNGGTCDYTNNSYNCDCAPDFSGTYCEETTARQCPYNLCQNGGTCDYTNYSYNCDCAPDFSGTYCEETTVSQCPYNPCQNGGTCDYTNNSYNCDCAPGFSGKYCEDTTARQCPYNPCKNGGTCDYTNYNYNCDCAPGFSGTYCEKSVNVCASNPCRNGGTCNSGAGGYTCTCSSGFSGTHCENAAEQCPHNPCANGGTCDYRGYTYNCYCPLGFSGTYCENNDGVNQCAGSPCLNGGTCSNGVTGFSCTCSTGYIGTRCEKTIVQCPYNPCENGGTCDYSGYSYNCYCRPGFSGTYCEIGG